MRLVVLGFALVLSGCGGTTTPSAPLSTAPRATIVSPSAAGTSPTSDLAASPVLFSFDVRNESSRGVIVSVASDYGASLPGFAAGQKGTISIHLLNPTNGIGVEIQDGACGLLAKALYPTPEPFTLIVKDGASTGQIVLSTVTEVAPTPLPLPSNDLQPCFG